MFSQLGIVNRVAHPYPHLGKSPGPFISIFHKIVLIDRFCQNEVFYCNHWKIVTIIKIAMGNGMTLEVVLLHSAQTAHCGCISA